jgi:hypothetical protein
VESAELTRELTAIVTKVSQLEPEIQRSAIDGGKALKQAEAQAKEIASLQLLIDSLNKQIEFAHAEIKDQALKDVEHKEALDKLFRLVTETQKRLDGDSITNISYANYETVRETAKLISETLSSKGGVSYDEIKTSYSNTKFLTRVAGVIFSLIGLSGISAILFAVFGIPGDSKLTLQKLANEQNEIKTNQFSLRKDIDSTTESFKLFRDGDFKDLKNDTKFINKQLFDLVSKK